MDFGKQIREARLARGLTMEELAELVGVNRSAICRWESGEYFPRKIEVFFRLGTALDLDLNKLLKSMAQDRKAPESIMAQ